LPAFRTVLAATDRSDAGNAALRYAYGLAGPDGTVFLCHVLPPRAEPDGAALAAIEAELRALVPPAAEPSGIATHVAVVADGNPAEAILGLADRFDVAAICVGT